MPNLLRVTDEQLDGIYYALLQEWQRNGYRDTELLTLVEQARGKAAAREKEKQQHVNIQAKHTEILRNAAKPEEIRDLMAPECTLGYTDEQITRIMGARLYDFRQWMNGQTGGICEGREFNYETREYEPTGCGPHEYVTYRQDVERFLLGLPVVD